MSIENGNGKGNLAISYLFPENNLKNQIELEQKLKNEIAEVLSKNEIKKFYIADDEFINETLVSKLENNILNIEKCIEHLKENGYEVHKKYHDRTGK